MGRTRLMSIGDAARASGLSAKALRLYDETGLLPPVRVDPVTGYRWYAVEQLDRARLVARLRLAGMPLARIRVVADLADRSGRAAAAELTSWWRQVEADTLATRALVGDLVAELDEETVMENTIDTIEQREARAASYLAQGARRDQQDAVLVGGGVYAVADGVGDAPGTVAADVLEVVSDLDEGDALTALDAAVGRAAALVGERYAGHPEAATTLTALVLRDGRAALAHVGDTRAYRVRAGRLERLTRDHSVVQTLVDEGRLTPEEARTDDRRVLIDRAIAPGAPYAPDLALHAVEPGDRFVLTSDGVHARLEPGALAALLVADLPPDEVAVSVRAAVEAAGADDNHAVVVVDVATGGA
ncbi:MerR family transcriptional regulator [Nocardioides rubriscoriae]|uniref:MerR family transcriptional regulator n=1 Tax=Nocardioides rubriscoriae TaxID=642762 RepID=UPI001B86CB3C|nr:MerR family transcriptional regulator [Nocardioides rubriscoriae]